VLSSSSPASSAVVDDVDVEAVVVDDESVFPF
jgi:hypothetical protein